MIVLVVQGELMMMASQDQVMLKQAFIGSVNK